MVKVNQREKMNRTTTSQALCARAIRKELKDLFPLTKFSVTSHSGANTSSVRISWVDGPTNDRVNDIVGKYQYGHFDGMTDCYEYSNGRDDLPQAKYIFAQRELSEEVTRNCIKVIAEEYGFECPEELSKSFVWSDEYWNAYQIVWKFTRTLDFTKGKSIKHIEDYSGSTFECFEVVQ